MPILLHPKDIPLHRKAAPILEIDIPHHCCTDRLSARRDLPMVSILSSCMNIVFNSLSSGVLANCSSSTIDRNLRISVSLSQYASCYPYSRSKAQLPQASRSKWIFKAIPDYAKPSQVRKWKDGEWYQSIHGYNWTLTNSTSAQLCQRLSRKGWIDQDHQETQGTIPFHNSYHY